MRRHVYLIGNNLVLPLSKLRQKIGRLANLITNSFTTGVASAAAAAAAAGASAAAFTTTAGRWCLCAGCSGYLAGGSPAKAPIT
jgi:hypothetical protein